MVRINMLCMTQCGNAELMGQDARLGRGGSELPTSWGGTLGLLPQTSGSEVPRNGSYRAQVSGIGAALPNGW